MRLVDGTPVFSPSDLTGFLACDHLLTLELQAMAGALDRPDRDDPELAVLQRRGMEHEGRYLESLRAAGKTIMEVGANREELSTSGLARLRELNDRTIMALRAGPDVIYQAAFFDGRWQGYADFLLRVETPSDLGAFSYEVADTKLARHAKAAALLQTCAYSAQLEAIQGRPPERIHVVLGDQSTASFRYRDYAAYFRSVGRQFEHAAMAERMRSTYPDRVEHCEVCRWSDRCTAQWRNDDHLIFVAGLGRLQVAKLTAARIPTLTALAGSAVSHVPGIGDPTLARLELQARLQQDQKTSGTVAYKLLVPEGPDRGLARLPESSEGDLFFDMEGDPLIEGGLEYLFGVAWQDRNGTIQFKGFWGHDRAGERKAFEDFIDFVFERRRQFPDLHVYHYASYEETALKKLMGVHATREDAVDTLLREGVLVDLYRIVRQGVAVSQESYSIKKLEPLYMGPRAGAISDAGGSIVAYETWLETGEQRILDDIEAYNRDDCISTLRLRAWLDDRRSEAEAMFATTLRPTPPERAKETEVAPEDENRLLVAGLCAGVPAEGRSAAQQARWLLAQLLGYHRREKKSLWWEYFDRCDMSTLELLEDGHAIGGLEPVGAPEKVKRSTWRHYRFPDDQEHRLKIGDKPHDPATQKKAGEIIALGDGTLRLNHGLTTAIPQALIPAVEFIEKELRDAIRRVAEWTTLNDIDAAGYARAGRDILLRSRPRLTTGSTEPLRRPGETATAAARRLVQDLDRGCLPIQGPPGTGKTFTGAEMAVDLIEKGKKVGVVAQSHAVIGNLLDEICRRADARGVTVRIAQKAKDDEGARDERVRRVESKEVRAALADGLEVIGGTTWLFARADLAEAIDVLFIDEAGQFALANAIAVAACARTIVLLGDPTQLAQPSKGAHPVGSDASVLQHVLGDDVTISEHAGLFLDRTFRLRPEVCAFVSDAFYESRLTPMDETSLRSFAGAGGNGLRFEAVTHVGNRIESPEEARRVEALVRELLSREWTEESGTRPIGLNDILIVAPYNAQVELLRKTLPAGARVGTVDKFQGQQAPVAIYSMASSTPEDAPRGMDFLYSRNRLNVAVSRAQGRAIIVASPALFKVRCTTPEQMRLANALCLFAEMAGRGSLDVPGTARRPFL